MIFLKEIEMLKFATEIEAMQYLADITGKRVKIAVDAKIIVEVYRDGKLDGKMDGDKFRKSLGLSERIFLQDAIKKFNEEMKKQDLDTEAKISFE